MDTGRADDFRRDAVRMAWLCCANCVLAEALLHKSVERRVSPFPGRTYPTASVTGMPSAV